MSTDDIAEALKRPGSVILDKNSNPFFVLNADPGSIVDVDGQEPWADELDKPLSVAYRHALTWREGSHQPDGVPFVIDANGDSWAYKSNCDLWRCIARTSEMHYDDLYDRGWRALVFPVTETP